MTHFVMVIAMLIGGHLQYMEIGPYDTLPSCRSEFERLVDKYVADGVSLNDINGDCYAVTE